MKFLVLLLVVIGALAWLAIGRRKSSADSRRDPPADMNRSKAGPAPADAKASAGPQAMVACAHCGVHLPEADALRDAAGRLFCSEAHRLAGPGKGS